MQVADEITADVELGEVFATLDAVGALVPTSGTRGIGKERLRAGNAREVACGSQPNSCGAIEDVLAIPKTSIRASGSACQAASKVCADE